MVQPILVKGEIRVTLPLKSFQSDKHRRRQLEDQEKQDGIQSSPKWQVHDSRASNQATLAIKRRAHQYYKRQAQKQAMSVSIVTQMPGPTIDPFQTWPIESTPEVTRMAQYFVQNWAPEHGRAFAIPGHSNPYLSLIWPFALQNHMYFEALIALCLASWLPSQGMDWKRDRIFLYHRGNVVASLRNRLRSSELCCDNVTLLTVATLGTIDYVTGEHGTAVSHIEGMRRMLSMRGGIGGQDPLEQVIKINIEAYESLWTFVTESTSPTDEMPTSPSLLQKGQLPTYMAHPYRPEVCAILSKLPQGFCDLGLQGEFSLQMINILSALQDTFVLIGSAQESITPVKAESPAPFPNSATKSQAPEIAELLKNLSRLATLQTTLTEHILCYGLLAYCYILRHLHFSDSFGAFYACTMDVLTQRCLRHSPETESLDRKCYLWASVMIGTALMHVTCPSDNRFAVFEDLISRYVECQELDLLLSSINQFFWSPELEAMVRKSWEEAMNREECQKMETKRTDVQTVQVEFTVKIGEPERPSRMKIRDVIL